MNCPRCGADNRDGAKRCRNCGTPLPAQPSPPVASQQQQMPVPPLPGQQLPPLYGQPSYGPPLAPPAPVVAPAPRAGLRTLSQATIGIGCLLLFIGFLLGIVALLGGQVVLSVLAPTTPTATVQATSPTPSPTSAHPGAGTSAPKVQLKNVDDQLKELTDLIAGKYAVIIFWTNSNKNDEAMTLLQKTATDKADKFVAIGINPAENRNAIKNVVQSKNLQKFTMLIDDTGSAMQAYGVKDSELPIYFLIGKDGKITEYVVNASRQDLEGKLNALIR